MAHQPVIVRFAPSPTGMLHIGVLRTALFNWLWAKKNHGTFILRIEDTDRTRLVPGSVENIQESLAWYGITVDQGPIFQSERTDRYRAFAEQLIASGNAYRCFCTPERLTELRKLQEANRQPTRYDRLCCELSEAVLREKINQKLPYTVRLRIPAGERISFTDTVRGEVAVDSDTLDDQVLLKSDGFPTYHLANVVDDHEMGVTHVIRAEEWLPSTPKHILLYRAFGWQPPVFAHLPMVLGPDRAKLSKRHGAMPALEYRNAGYVPEAIINYIALLGWNPKSEQEVFSREELVQAFDITQVNKSGAIFSTEKLDWLNGHYLRTMPLPQLLDHLKPFVDVDLTDERVQQAVDLVRDRARRLTDFQPMLTFITVRDLTFDPLLLIPKGGDKEKTQQVLAELIPAVEALPETDFSSATLKERLTGFISSHGYSNSEVLWPLRIALTGQQHSPGTFEVMATLGKQWSLERIRHAVKMLI